MTEECLFEVLGSPEPVELVRVDGKPTSKNVPSQLVAAVSWFDWTDEDEEDLRIIDLGEAFLQGGGNKKLAQPSSMQAPETIFTDSLDHRLDVWRAGIVVRKLRFNIFEESRMNSLDRFIFSYSGKFHLINSRGAWIPWLHK